MNVLRLLIPYRYRQLDSPPLADPFLERLADFLDRSPDRNWPTLTPTEDPTGWMGSVDRERQTFRLRNCDIVNSFKAFCSGQIETSDDKVRIHLKARPTWFVFGPWICLGVFLLGATVFVGSILGAVALAVWLLLHMLLCLAFYGEVDQAERLLLHLGLVNVDRKSFSDNSSASVEIAPSQPSCR